MRCVYKIVRTSGFLASRRAVSPRRAEGVSATTRLSWPAASADEQSAVGSCSTLCRLMAAARACYEDQGEASRRLASSTDASILFRPRTVSELRWNPRLVLYGVHRVVDDLHEAEADDELVLDDVVDLGCKHGLHEALPVRDDCAVPVGGPCPDFFHGEALPIIVQSISWDEGISISIPPTTCIQSMTVQCTCTTGSATQFVPLTRMSRIAPCVSCSIPAPWVRVGCVCV